MRSPNAELNEAERRMENAIAWMRRFPSTSHTLDLATHALLRAGFDSEAAALFAHMARDLATWN